MRWLLAAAVLLIIAFIPVGICFIYNMQGPYLYLRIGLIKICLHPRNKSSAKSKKPNKANRSSKPEKEEKKQSGSLSDFIPILQIVFDFLHDFRRKLRITNLQMKLIFANSDPSDLAIAYGSAWAILGNIMPLFEQYFVIKKRHLEVECDFQATENVLDARIDVLISFGALLYILSKHGFRGLKKYIELTKKLKAV